MFLVGSLRRAKLSYHSWGSASAELLVDLMIAYTTLPAQAHIGTLDAADYHVSRASLPVAADMNSSIVKLRLSRFCTAVL
jgi:hypothetical protein